jgi:hypothetical protein
MSAQSEEMVSDYYSLFKNNFNTANIQCSFEHSVVSETFNFKKMNIDDSIKNKNNYYKIYFHKDLVKRISAFDSTNVNNNFEIDVLHISNAFIIASIFIFDDYSHEKGKYFNGFLLNDKINDRTIIFELDPDIDNSLYLSRLVFDIQKTKIRNYEPNLEENCGNYIKSIIEIDQNGFPKRRTNWHKGIQISYSCYIYKKNKIIEELTFIDNVSKLKNSKIDSINNYILNDLYSSFKNMGSVLIPIRLSISYSKDFSENKPLWLLDKYYYYYTNRYDVESIEFPNNR